MFGPIALGMGCRGDSWPWFLLAFPVVFFGMSECNLLWLRPLAALNISHSPYSRASEVAMCFDFA